LFDDFARLLKKNFFTANTLSPPAGIVPAAIKAAFATQTGHIGSLRSPNLSIHQRDL
jgi:hypothetical protein